VPITLASDIHLRPDRPERGDRLARLVDALDPAEPLILAGDLCDFWFASRGPLDPDPPCAGLRSLRRFTGRGGSITILAGNHDAWLGDYYRQVLGAKFLEGPSLDWDADGLRLHVVHGHRLGARPPWKAAMESRTFLQGFRAAPLPAAAALAWLLDRSNDATNARNNQRHLAIYRQYADSLADRADLVVFGHTHLTLDDASQSPRMVVLGDWKHQASYLRIDDQGARLVVLRDEPVGTNSEILR
jgi:UDP-2,3-diacylglucosamine hydrolase